MNEKQKQCSHIFLPTGHGKCHKCSATREAVLEFQRELIRANQPREQLFGDRTPKGCLLVPEPTGPLKAIERIRVLLRGNQLAMVVKMTDSEQLFLLAGALEAEPAIARRGDELLSQDERLALRSIID